MSRLACVTVDVSTSGCCIRRMHHRRMSLQADVTTGGCYSRRMPLPADVSSGESCLLGVYKLVAVSCILRAVSVLSVKRCTVHRGQNTILKADLTTGTGGQVAAVTVQMVGWLFSYNCGCSADLMGGAPRESRVGPCPPTSSVGHLVQLDLPWLTYGTFPP